MVPRLWSQGLREDVCDLLFRVNVLDVNEGVLEDVVGTGKVNLMGARNLALPFLLIILIVASLSSRTSRRTARFKMRHHICRVGRASENKLWARLMTAVSVVERLTAVCFLQIQLKGKKVFGP